MKAKIHPKYEEAIVTCACGNSFGTLSTMKSIKVDVCAACHPFYTGKQKFVDTAGRVEKFQKKYGWNKDISADMIEQKAKKTPTPKQEEKVEKKAEETKE